MKTISRRGRKKTADKFASSIGTGTPLAVGRIIAHLMRRKITYERARAYFSEDLPPDARLSKNTVDKYWKQYKDTIRAASKKAGRDEKIFCDEFFKAQSEIEEKANIDARRDSITYQLPGRGNTKQLAAAIEQWLPTVAANEAARIRKHSLDADHLVVTISYRPHKKSKP